MAPAWQIVRMQADVPGLPCCDHKLAAETRNVTAVWCTLSFRDRLDGPWTIRLEP
jgi:hypothetical protein